uniref:Uncharacterized protein n=1 Tax=Trypanosoma congolense (strain IL3000) TaxID=1068625 RepID=G0URK0_TRYCI|nr:conserved hypothetical protein [Trypanosoma congolense IL3000]
MSGGEHHTTSPKDWLFAWEIIASFSPPRTVCDLEALSRDVRQVLRESSTGTRLLQRYWNVQYHRLVWGDVDMDVGRRTLHFTLSRTCGRKDWKKLYREEYPLWLARSFQGKGSRNNDINEARVRFQMEPVNERLPGEVMESLQLTEEETLERRRMKGLLCTEGDGDDVLSPTDRGPRQKKGVRRETDEKPMMKNPSLVLTREDYKNDSRLQKHKLKHKKGGKGTRKGYEDD